MFNKAAIDYARERNHPDIVDVLTRGPNQIIKNTIERNKKLLRKIQTLTRDKLLHNRQRINKSRENGTESEDKNKQLLEKVNKLKTYLSALKTKQAEIEFVNINDFEEVSVIGEGATSNVKQVVKKERYAKKELKEFDNDKLQRFLSEGEILSKLRHPCIIDIVGVNYGDATHPPAIFLSLEPKSLETAISNKELQEEDKNRIVVEIVLIMRYIHKRNFTHSDLKPSNILLSKNNQVRISDFGFVKYDDMSISQTKGDGTLRFIAPELCEDGETGTAYANKVDVYSFRITLIYIITEKYPPFSMKNVVLGIVPKIPETVVGWASNLIARCLSPESENRPSFNEIFEELKLHNFDIFNDKSDGKLTRKQSRMKHTIESRVLEIETFEYQHQED